MTIRTTKELKNISVSFDMCGFAISQQAISQQTPKTDLKHWLQDTYALLDSKSKRRHNDHDDVSNHNPHGCLLNR